MGMLDRYKKSGGFVQLLNLIETSPDAKQEKFLALIQEENVAWEVELRKKKLTFAKICKWETSHLMEITPRIPDKVMAIALQPLAPADREPVMKALTHAQRRTAEDYIANSKPGPGEVPTCQAKVVTEVRKAIQEGALKLEKIDPELAIPDNIEELLNSGAAGAGSFKFTSPSGSTAMATSSANATQSDSVPGAVMDELKELRRRLQHIQVAYEQLERDNKSMKDKLEQIKKIA